MKVFISADIEGTAFTTYWEETEKDKLTYPRAAEEMTREVRAAIDGALAAGATEILVNDAHDYGINLDPFRMPENVSLIRGWSGSPCAWRRAWTRASTPPSLWAGIPRRGRATTPCPTP